MPKSKRSKVVHLTSVTKKTREQKEQLFGNIRQCVPEYQHCFVFSVDNMRNNQLKDLRRDMADSRMFFGKTKLMARALGQTPEDEQADGIHGLARHLTGTVGLIFTNRDPSDVLSTLQSVSAIDFARAGAVAPRGFRVPPGVVYSTGGEVPAEDDVPMAHSIEPELRKLGVPTRLVKGKVVLGAEDGSGSEGYVVCREGDVLDGRQTRLLKLFSVCLSEFRVRVLAYWSAASSEVTEVEADPAAASMEEDSD
ncbi:mRNA turnover protein 4 [Gaeumannomyces tritici R3-111a-1]|uniref:Ribosome assembly factor mrt4 n=1 Tax=Gaeumannomyces tritici (strain R3-111a-1) TaxID=644352 RepID=J3P3K4_GAET3|nr:mRNA turnover protein 4 [Gaeumannomyces tritici R3-111a-1]EJT74247.1 mRNA turnover protein 4 [Gaeumannomyces tritici R3-111a-1]